jgi:hypothetical protein
MDFKPSFIFIGSLFLVNINNFLVTTALILNVFYISYQIYTHSRNNDKNK